MFRLHFCTFQLYFHIVHTTSEVYVLWDKLFYSLLTELHVLCYQLQCFHYAFIFKFVGQIFGFSTGTLSVVWELHIPYTYFKIESCKTKPRDMRVHFKWDWCQWTLTFNEIEGRENTKFQICASTSDRIIHKLSCCYGITQNLHCWTPSRRKLQQSIDLAAIYVHITTELN
jgi:hypothetical protein